MSSTHSVGWVSPRGILGIMKRRKNLWTLPIKPEMVQPAAYSLYFAITHHNQNIITKEWKQCHKMLRQIITERQCE